MNSQIVQSLPITNLHKHTSFVFAITLHQVVLYHHKAKYEKLKQQKYPNWEAKRREIEIKHIEYLVTGGADKNIYLWDIETLNTEPKVVQLFQNKELLREQQQQEINENIEFTDDQLRFGHYVIDKQVNHYEYITCLTSVRLDQFTTYLIAGYESNQIIRYQVESEYWLTGSNQLRHSITKQDAKLLTAHNDSVVSVLYMNGFLYSSGEDMQVIQQDIDGNIIRRFYFDSVVSQLTKYQNYLVFMYQSVETVEQMMIEDNAVTEYLVVNNIMFFGSQENFKIRVRPTTQPKSTIALAYDASDPINCFEVRTANLGQSITYGTVSGQLGRIPFQLEGDREITENCHKREDQVQQSGLISFTFKNNSIQQDTYKYIYNETNAVNVHQFDTEITALMWRNDSLYVITKTVNGSNLNILNSTYRLERVLKFEFRFLLTDVREYGDKDKPGTAYQVHLQNLLYVPQRGLMIVGGDMLRLFYI